MVHFSHLLIALSVTINLLFILQPLANKLGLIDHPNFRKIHQTETPLVGGIAMFCGFILAVLLLDQPLSGLRSLFAGSVILIIIGILDDLHELSAKTRFMAEIIAALLVCLGGETLLNDFGAISWTRNTVELGQLAIPLTVFAIVGVINALNMSDGMDGLAGSLVLVTLFGLMVITWQAGLYQPFWLLSLLMVTVIAFLSFNLRYPGQTQALVFMGDAGSMFLGFILAWFMINLSQGPHRAMTPVTALWIFALPLFDTVSIMTRRILKGHSPFQADKQHFHHLWLKAGFTVSQTLVIILSVASGLAFIGIVGLYAGISEAIMFWGFLSLFGIYLMGMMIAWQDFQNLMNDKPSFFNKLGFQKGVS